MTADHERESPPSDDSSPFAAIDDESSHLPTKLFNRREYLSPWTYCCQAISRFFGKRKNHEILGVIDLSSIWSNPRVDGSIAIAHLDFEIHERLSDSKSSQIFLIRMFHTGKLAVLKCNEKAMNKTGDMDRHKLRLERELNIWKALYSHPNVTKLYTTFETDKYFCFVMQYVPFRSLHDLICQGFTFDRRALKKIFAELASVLHTMHAVGVIHREITCSNILLSKGFSCLLSDFSSSVAASSSKRRTGSLAYMAPEMVARSTYNEAADWWSYGIVLYAVTHKSTPLNMHLEHTGVDLEELDEAERFRLAANVKVRLEASLPMATRSLISELLREKPENRLGVRYSNFELLRNHPFFIGHDWHHLIAAEARIISSPKTESLLAESTLMSTLRDDSSDCSSERSSRPA